MTGSGALPSHRAAQPTRSSVGAGDSGGSRTVQWKGISLALSGFHCPSWLPARLTRLLGKGPCSLPQALHAGTPDCPPGKEGIAGPLVSPPAHPGALGSPRAPVGAEPSLPTNGLFSWLPLHQARSEVLGAPAWSWGLDPDHKARDPPGISGEMLLAKPPGLQRPDRKPPSLPCGFPAPAKTDPGA